MKTILGILLVLSILFVVGALVFFLFIAKMSGKVLGKAKKQYEAKRK